MGLVRSFVAEDLVQYEVWPLGNVPGVISYNQTLIQSPRVCGETIYRGYYGALYTQAERTPWGDTTINYINTVAQVAWPSWGVNRWKFDGQYGRFLDRKHGGTAFGPLAVTGGQYAFEPSGFLWTYAAHPFTDNWSAVVMDQEALVANVGMGAVDMSLFRTRTGGDVLAIYDFNIDRTSDRMFARWAVNNVGCVSMYKYSTREWLADLHVPNQTRGIVLTHDGFAYIADTGDWICVYDYDGRYHRAFKNPRREALPNGFAYGWDRFYKRLLFAPVVDDATDGTSRIRIRGFYPVPEAAVLSPPIPREVPRAGRRTSFFFHLNGEGAEPLSSRRGQLSGDVSGSVVSDAHGDFVGETTPDAAGELDVTLTVDVPDMTIDPPEPDHSTAGRSLVVTMDLPISGHEYTAPGGQPVPFRCTVQGHVGATTVKFKVESFAYGPSEFDGVQVDGDTWEVTAFTSDVWWPGTWRWCAVVAVATDSTGNTGMSGPVAFSAGV